ncbi:MAG: deoxyguanosinetriphosphate triphosphohydrolase [Roseburia sp.]|uniref:deoxyguanosinetriphosphate triphosphohydrolase n=1 Tax=Roseburia sp. 831b TaxID=1261635 RepID=UPI0009517522|nr:deoxyguanosinetriphosphate triphosphohydrolase [Roseburia sp. 831b]MDD6216745.1 deoxyguanosinetriphosphate triphosphohydrolase [Roseburia sp.]WVK71958.1 deoxyguanosinetriphosphate triphosphohydrolase [Roseburia sp. 831b]
MEWNKLLSLECQVEKEQEPKDFEKYPISDLEKDYQAIISSSAFRRLQDKTQVFPLDKSDFVRTRLTHSIEVSTIARQLGIMVTQNKTDYLPKEFSNDIELTNDIPIALSCAGLLHDIGNPPFGHFGEVVIGEWFEKNLKSDKFTYKGKKIADILTKQMKQDLMNFEGNAQALRILSKARNHAEGYDINLSYGVLNTLIKYPTNSLEFNPKSDDTQKHKLGYYYAERNIMEKICKATGTYRDDGEGYSRHPLVYLMEAADDIAYATADLEDAMKKRLFTLDQFVSYFEGEVTKIKNSYHNKRSEELLNNLKDRINPEKRNPENDLISFQKWMEYVRKWLMYVVAYCFSKNYNDIMGGKYTYDMFKDTNHEATIEILKAAMKEFVYDDKEILKLELAAKKIITSLLDDFINAVLYYDLKDENYKPSTADKKLINIISANYKEDYQHAKTNDEYENLYLRFLMVTDYISGMTDTYARNLYRELNGLD